MRRSPLLVIGLCLALVLGACGDDEDPPSGESGTTTTDAGGTTTTGEDETTTTGDDGSTTTEGTPTTPDPASLPGEVVEIFPYEGADLWVVGVAADDTLNVRVGPGTDFDVVSELDPLADGLVATGQNRSIDDGSAFWSEIEVDGATGWVNRRFVAELGDVSDITSQLPQGLEGETMLDLADAVADARAGVEEGPAPEVTVVDGPTVGDLGEITVDLIGYQDDAVAGERLHIFATPDPSGEGFRLRTVEATVMCSRGVSGGLCV